MKDVMTPAAPEEVRAVIKKCLENAALVNYQRISEQAKIEGIFSFDSITVLKLFVSWIKNRKSCSFKTNFPYRKIKVGLQ